MRPVFIIQALFVTLLVTPMADAKAVKGKSKEITFKGVPFDSSIAVFSESFSDAVCDLSVPLMPVCSGGPIEYLGKSRAFYIAYFSPTTNGKVGRLREVRIAIPSTDAKHDHKDISSKISLLFGGGKNLDEELEGKEVSEIEMHSWSVKKSSITTSICQKRDESGYALTPDPSKPSSMFVSFISPFCPGQFVYLKISSGVQYSVEMSPKSDF